MIRAAEEGSGTDKDMSENANENGICFEGFNLEPYQNGWLVRSYVGDATELAIPAEVQGKPVVIIAAKAFEDNRNITSVVIPDTVTFIGNYAFWNCTALEHVVVGRGMSTLNLGTFTNCTSLSQVDLPDTMTSIGDGVFQDCTALSAITIPTAVESLGDRCFMNCTSLTTVVLPPAITTIMRNCFRGCTSLSTVIMPGNVEYIGPRAFQECPALESVTFQEGPIETTMNAMRNYSLLCFAIDEAVKRNMVSFEEALKLLHSKSDRERLLGACTLATYPERSREIGSKQAMTCALAAAGRTEELRRLEDRPGFFIKLSLLKCIDVANAAGRTETAAYLLDLAARQEGPAPASRSTGLEL